MSTGNTATPTVEGYLPVKVLQHLILGWFERISPELLKHVEEEQEKRGLQKGVGYHVDDIPIDDVAWIDPDTRKIHLKEPYLQMLWCACYALVVLYEDGFLKEGSKGGEEVRLDIDDPVIEGALSLMDAGVSLLEEFVPEKFAALPQPRTPNSETDMRIDKASNVFVAAGAFILMHEVAHQKLDHLTEITTGDESIKEEIQADSYALSFLKRGLGKDKEHDSINTLGVIAVMTTFILLCPTFEGGDDHPDLDIRYLHALESLGLDGAEEMWIVACLSLRLYSRYHGVIVFLPRGRDLESYRDLFYIILVQVVQQKHPRYWV